MLEVNTWREPEENMINNHVCKLAVWYSDCSEMILMVMCGNNKKKPILSEI